MASADESHRMIAVSTSLSLLAPTSKLPAVIGPVEDRLPLSSPAIQVALFAVLHDLADMPLHRTPSSDLSLVIGAPSACEVPAIPLKPAPRVIAVDPAPFAPFGQGQRGIYPKEVERRVMDFMTEAGLREPSVGKLIGAIGHILAAKYAECKHLLRGQVRPEGRVIILPRWLGKQVFITLLHEIVHDDELLLHDRAG